jgi:hypothetical protein
LHLTGGQGSLALRRIVTQLFMSGGMLLMSGKNDLADIARGQTLRLGTFEGQDIAIPVRPRAELGKRRCGSCGPTRTGSRS